MSGWRSVPLGSVVEPIQTWSPSKARPEGKFIYIDVGSVDHNLKTISGPRELWCREAPSRARQIVVKEDILVSTVRPNLNGVARVTKELEGATASTGLCVLRVRAIELDPSYLFEWVKSSGFMEDMIRKATGASYPAVSDRIILESLLPLPPLPEQRRIAEVLDRAEALRAKRRAALAELESLGQSIFLELFGDPEASAWPLGTIADMAHSTPGSIRTGPFGSQLLHSEFVAQGVAVLGIDNVVANEFRWGAERFVTAEKYRDLRRYTVRPGDVLITIMGTCGRCAIVPDDLPVAINTKHLCCITLNPQRCIPAFLHAYFLLHPLARRYLDQAAKGAIMAGLNMGLIKAMPIPLAPLALQQDFARRIAAVEKLKAAHRASLAEMDALFASLQHRAFRGEL